MLKFDVHGKWILAGEHSVLRGSPAIVFPVSSRKLTLIDEGKDQGFEVELKNSSPELDRGFWKVFDRALELLEISKEKLKGKITIENNIPIGAGMGASATLCVALGKWFSAKDLLPENQIFNFAKSLEDVFHGTSSGLDVAVALNNRPLMFHVPNQMIGFEPTWKPIFYLSHTGKASVTSECIQKVEELLKSNSKLGKTIDEAMEECVLSAKKALTNGENLDKLRDSITLANTCFEKWGLVNQEMRSHMSQLTQHGAIAVKPTGSGDGGFILSLWKEQPKTEAIPFEMMEC